MAVPADEKGAKGIPKGEVYVLAGILLIAFLLRMVFLHEPFERDEGLYGYIGQEILRGAIPYRDIADIKPPGSFYLYAAMITLFGNSLEAIRVATGIYALFTTFFVYRVARYLLDRFSGLAAALLFAIFSAAPLLQGSSSNTEVFMLLPLVLSVYFLLRGADSGREIYFAGSGFCAGCAVLVKTVAAPYALVLFLFLLFRPGLCSGWRQRLKEAGMFLIPPLTTALMTLGYFAAHGALADLYYWNVSIHKMYVQTDRSMSFGYMKDSVKLLFAEQGLLWVAGVGGSILFILARRGLGAWLLAALLPVSCLGVALPGYFYPHYFIQLAPFSAVAAGVGLGIVWQKKGLALFLTLPLVLLGLIYHVKADYRFYLTYTPDQVSTYKYKMSTFAESVRVADYVRARTLPEDYIVQWGFEPEVYFYSNRRGLKNLATFLGIGWSPNPRQATATMLSELDLKKPKYIILQQGGDYFEGNAGFAELANVIKRDYFLESQVDYALLFRRK